MENVLHLRMAVATPQSTTTPESLVNSALSSELPVIEIRGRSRSEVIRHMIGATDLALRGDQDLETLVAAVQEREEIAHTLVADGFAIPHAFSNWDGEFSAVLGWSPNGVDFGAADESGLVHLALLLIFGKRGRERHLEYLAAFAEFFSDDLFRVQLIDAKSASAVERLVRKRADVGKTNKNPNCPRVNAVLLQQAIDVVPQLSAQAILISADKLEFVPWNRLATWNGRLLVVSPDDQNRLPERLGDAHLIDVPKVSLARNDRANLGLLLAAAKGLVRADADVVCLGSSDGRRLDSLTVCRPPSQFSDVFFGDQRRRQIMPSVILRIISLALEIAEEGREGNAVGTAFVIGDTRQVRKHTTQLVLNPFHGYSRHLRNILDPSLAETIKEFAVLDGAFIVQDDGMVVSAGTYIIPKAASNKLPPGLGTRHQAAAAITAQTDAMAIVVSQSTGTVLVMRRGKVVLELERAGSLPT